MKELSFSICMPVYKGSHVLGQALGSIMSQAFGDYEVIVGDDNRPEDIEEIERTEQIIASYGNPRIILQKNVSNLGYPKNLQAIVARASKEVIFLMAQDDILAKDALHKVHDAFFLDQDVGCVTRPYFWFYDDWHKPVRAVEPYDPDRDSVISIFDGKREFGKIFESVGQLSGLAYLRRCMEVPFHDEVFPAHIYPFAGILRKHKCVFLKDYTVAVGIKDSQTRSVSSIYDLSPTESWVKMFRSVFAEEQFRQQREWGVEHIAKEFVGLVQIKNYARAGVLSKEIMALVRSRPRNLFEPAFWFFALGALVMPRSLLIPLVDWYKSRLGSRSLHGITFNG